MLTYINTYRETMTEPTRDNTWRRLHQTHQDERARMTAWHTFPLIESIPDQEWAEMHTQPCGACGQPGRLYPGGWRCGDHQKPSG